MRHTPFAGARATATNFANLLGFHGASKAKKAEGDTREDDEEARKGRRAEEDKTREEEDARRAEEDDRREEEDARRAEEDGDDAGDDDDSKKKPKDEGDDSEDDDDTEEKSKGKKKGKKSASEDDEDKKDDDKSKDDDKEEKSKKAERSRWTRVLGHANAGGGRVAAACNLLATTDMSANAVIATLATLPTQAASGRRSLSERMDTAKPANPGAGATGAGSGPTLAQQIIHAGKIRRGEV